MHSYLLLNGVAPSLDHGVWPKRLAEGDRCIQYWLEPLPLAACAIRRSKRGTKSEADLPVEDLRGDRLRAHEFAEQANNFLRCFAEKNLPLTVQAKQFSDGDPRRDLPVEPVG